MDKKTMIENLAREAYEKGGLSGAWLYAENGGIVSKGALGWSDPDGRVPLTEDMVFDLASVSKQFTAAAIMLLRRRGLLDLDDEVSKFFPEISYDGITVRRLLNHTSGIPDCDDELEAEMDETGRIPGNDIILRILGKKKPELLFTPGERFEYCNEGYWLLAEIIEKLSGTKFEDFMRDNVFEPAGMHSTRIWHRRADAISVPNLAFAQIFENGRYILPDDSKERSPAITQDGVNGDGLVHSSIGDLFAWDRVLRSGTLITREEQAMMYAPGLLSSGERIVDGDDGDNYGLGWFVTQDEELGLIVSHSGGMPGVNTWFERFIDADRVLIVLINRDPEEYRAFAGFYNGIQKIAHDKEAESIKTIEDIALKNPDKSNWESFCGRYEHPGDDDFYVDEVWMHDGELCARAFEDDGDKMEFRLYPIGENKFGRKGGMLELTFGEGCVTYLKKTCKKL